MRDSKKYMENQKDRILDITATVRLLIQRRSPAGDTTRAVKAGAQREELLVAVAYLGGALRLGRPPFQPTLIFYDGIFGCFTNFFLLKHQNLGIQ